MKNLWLLAFCFFALRPSMCAGSALGDLAASMSPGQWKELPTQSLNNDTLLSMNVNGQLWTADMSTTWTNYLAWNPATQEIFWVGAPHLAPYAFIRYSATQNKWFNETNVPDCMRLGGYTGCFSHGYHHGTIDPEKGLFYFVSGSQFFAYNIAQKQWSSWTQAGLLSGGALGMEYFPPLRKLAHFLGISSNDGGIVQLIDPVARTREVAAQDLTVGGYHTTMTYSAPHRKLYFGGGNGSSDFYSMDSTKQAVRRANAPETYTCIGTSLVCDPITGNPLFLGNSNNYYVYNSAANQWTKITSPPAALINPSYSSISAMATGIPEYGVVFYMSPNLKKVYLYKHAAMSSQTEAPATRAAAAVLNLPNPAGRSAVMALKAAAGPALRIHDSRGRLVADASRIPAGLYMLEIISGAHRSVKRIAVIK